MTKVIDVYAEHGVNFDKSSKQLFSWKFIDKPALEKELEKVVNKDSRVLDAACGSGRIVELIQSYGVQDDCIVGIDSSSTLLDIAKDKYPSVHYILGDIVHHTDFGMKFNVVTCVHVLAELDLNQLAEAFKNFYDSLEVGGTLLYIVGHPIRYNNLDEYTSRGWREQKTPWGAIIKHYNKTIEDYIDATIKAGFTISAIREPAASDEGKQDSGQYDSYVSKPSRLLVVATKR